MPTITTNIILSFHSLKMQIIGVVAFKAECIQYQMVSAFTKDNNYKRQGTYRVNALVEINSDCKTYTRSKLSEHRHFLNKNSVEIKLIS